MLAVEPGHRDKRQMERRAKPARRSSRLRYPKAAARRLHQSRSAHKNQNPQNGHLMARFDWGFGAICFGASPVAAVFGSAPGSATPPEHRIHSNPNPRTGPPKQDISTLLGIGHFYFALTGAHECRRQSRATATAGDIISQVAVVGDGADASPPRAVAKSHARHQRAVPSGRAAERSTPPGRDRRTMHPRTCRQR